MGKKTRAQRDRKWEAEVGGEYVKKGEEEKKKMSLVPFVAECFTT